MSTDRQLATRRQPQPEGHDCVAGSTDRHQTPVQSGSDLDQLGAVGGCVSHTVSSGVSENTPGGPVLDPYSLARCLVQLHNGRQRPPAPPAPPRDDLLLPYLPAIQPRPPQPVPPAPPNTPPPPANQNPIMDQPVPMNILPPPLNLCKQTKVFLCAQFLKSDPVKCISC